MIKKYKRKHKILETLYNYQTRNHDVNPIFENISMSKAQISEKSGISIKDIDSEVDYLLLGEYIIKKGDNYLLIQLGCKAINEEEFLELGSKYYRDKLKDWLYIISGIILLGIALISFVINIIQTNKNTNEIGVIKKKIECIENKK